MTKKAGASATSLDKSINSKSSIKKKVTGNKTKSLKLAASYVPEGAIGLPPQMKKIKGWNQQSDKSRIFEFALPTSLTQTDINSLNGNLKKRLSMTFKNDTGKGYAHNWKVLNVSFSTINSTNFLLVKAKLFWEIRGSLSQVTSPAYGDLEISLYWPDTSGNNDPYTAQTLTISIVEIENKEDV